MATQLIATGSSAANSSDVTLAAGESAVFSLKAAATGAEARIEIKDDAGGYTDVGRLITLDPAKLVSGPGTYRVRRVASGSCGVFSG